MVLGLKTSGGVLKRPEEMQFSMTGRSKSFGLLKVTLSLRVSV